MPEEFDENALLDIDRRWPDLFAPLTDDQHREVMSACASLWFEDWNPDRDQVSLIIDSHLGRVPADEYDRRAADLARRAARG